MMEPLKIAVGVAIIAAIGGSLLSRNVAPPERSGAAAQAAPAPPGYFDGISFNRGPAAKSPQPVLQAAAPAPATQSGYSPTGASIVIEPDKAGHHHADIEINGHRVTMLVDTGASIIALTHEDAMSFGIRPFPSDYKAPISTANGTLRAAEMKIAEVRVGNILVRDVQAVVMPQGVLRQSLLGMSFLKKLGGFEIASGKMVLRQ